MGDRRQPTSPPANQRKPDPPPAPPPKQFHYDGVFVLCVHGHRHGSIVAAAACGVDD